MDEYLRFLRSRVGNALLLAPVTGVVARDDRERILLQRRSDDGRWGLPGGWMTPGESVSACALRETLEETGWRVELTGLLGLYTHPESQTHEYPNGDRAQFVAAIFEGRAVEHAGGRTDGEALEVRFFAPDELPPDESLNPPDRRPLDDARSREPRPFVR